MGNSFSDRIEAEIQRGEISSLEDEECSQLEGWLDKGAPVAGEGAVRFKDVRFDSAVDESP